MDTRSKIVGIRTLKRQLTSLRKTRRPAEIAFTNGCFDILHAGHVRYLEKAKKEKRILIVGLNSDKSVKRIKGPERPINAQKQRAEVLAGLACVDYVVVFGEETPIKLIEAVQPDVLIKGADWKGKGVVGSEFVEKRGGKIELISYVPNCSTTGILKVIKKRG